MEQKTNVRAAVLKDVPGFGNNIILYENGLSGPSLTSTPTYSGRMENGQGPGSGFGYIGVGGTTTAGVYYAGIGQSGNTGFRSPDHSGRPETWIFGTYYYYYAGRKSEDIYLEFRKLNLVSQYASVYPESFEQYVQTEGRYVGSTIVSQNYVKTSQMWCLRDFGWGPAAEWRASVKSGLDRGLSFLYWKIDGVAQEEGKVEVKPEDERKVHTLVAHFMFTEAAMTVKAGSGGSVSNGVNLLYSRKSSTSVTSTATEEEGTSFLAWYKGNGRNLDESACTSYISNNPTYTFTSPTGDEPDADVTYVAKFENRTSYTLNLTVQRDGAEADGTVTLTYGSATKQAATRNSFIATLFEGRTYTLTARNSNNNQNVFDGFYDSSGTLLTSSTTYNFTASGYTSITARFVEVPSYTVTTEVLNGGSSTISLTSEQGAKSDGTYRITDTVTATLVPELGYSAYQWDVTGYDDSTLASSLTNPNAFSFKPKRNNTVVKCSVEKNSVSYEIKLLIDGPSSDANAGTVELFDEENISYGGTSASVKSGTIVKASAVPNSGYDFDGWYDESGKIENKSMGYYLTVNQKRTLTAKFKCSVSFTLEDGTGQTGGGFGTLTIVDEDGTFNVQHGNSVTKDYVVGTKFSMKAAKTSDGRFVHFRTNTEILDWPSETVIDLTATESVSITARFLAAGPTSYISLRLTNGENGLGLGTLEATLGDTGVEIDKDEYQFYFEGKPPVAPTGGIDDGRDKFYIFGQWSATTITALLSEALKQSTPFKQWMVQTRERSGGTWQEPDGDHQGHWVGADWGDFSEEVVLTSANPTTLSSLEYDMLITATYYNGGPYMVKLSYCTGSDKSMGKLKLYPTGERYTATDESTSAWYREGIDVDLIATPNSGYVFDGWYISASGDQPLSPNAGSSVFTLDKLSKNIEVYAKFSEAGGEIYKWEGSAVNKLMEWRSKRHVSSVPFNLSAVRVDADQYPVELRIGTSSSPNAPSIDKVARSIPGQGAMRLPTIRPEKFVEIEVRSTGPVTAVVSATSMKGLNQ